MTTLFLSYARDDDEPFVQRLHGDLASRGFTVWWDRVSMPSRRLTFHQEIRDVVAQCDRLVLVLGPEAVTSDYVQQEWQFADKAGKIVTPILRRGGYDIVPPELHVHCEDFREEERYDFHLDQLVRQLSETPPRLGKLIAVPSLPPQYVERADRLRELCDALRVDLERPVVVSGSAARVGLHGMGGIGKSVLAASVANDRKIREAFPDGIVWVRLGQAPRLVELQRQVHQALGGDGAFTTVLEGAQELRELLAERAVLLILDDAWQREHVDAFDVLGWRCKALITTRDAGLITALGGTTHWAEYLNEQQARQLLAARSGQAEADLPSETAEILETCGRLPIAIALCGGMVRSGVPWKTVLQALRDESLGSISDRFAAEEQHRSIGRVIDASTQALTADERQRFFELAVFPPDESVRAEAVITLWEHTGKLSGLTARALLSGLVERSLVQLDVSQAAGESLARHMSLHPLMAQFVAQSAGDVMPLHQQMLAAYQAKCREGWASGPDDGYFFTHLRDHLTGANRVEELRALLQDFHWLEAKAAAGCAFDLLTDFAAARTGTAPDQYRTRHLRRVEEAIRRDAQFIVRHAADYPQGLFQCLWNTCWWYDAPEAARHYRPEPLDPKVVAQRMRWQPWLARPAAVLAAVVVFPFVKDMLKDFAQWHVIPYAFMLLAGMLAHQAVTYLLAHGLGGARWRQPPPWARPGEKLHQWMEAWRKHKEQHTPGFCWIRSIWPPRVPLGTTLEAILRGHQSTVLDVAFSADSRTLASASADGTVRLWDRQQGKELALFKAGAEGVCRVAISPDGSRVAGWGLKDALFVWDVAAATARYPDPAGAQYQVAGRETRGLQQFGFSRLGDRIRVLTVASDRRDEQVFDAASGKSVAGGSDWIEFDRHNLNRGGHALRLAFDRFANAVTLCDDRGALVARIGRHDDGVTQAVFSFCSRWIASGSADNTVRVWNADPALWAQSLEEPERIPVAERSAAAVAISRDRSQLAYSALNGLGPTLRVCDLQSYREKEFADPTREGFPASAVAFVPGSPLIVVAGGLSGLRLLDSVGVPQQVIDNKDLLPNCLAVSSDGQLLFGGTNSTRLGIWDLAGGRPLDMVNLKQLPEQAILAQAAPDEINPVRAVACAPDRSRFAVSVFPAVHIWETGPGGRHLMLAPGERDTPLTEVPGVNELQFSADGKRLAGGLTNNSVWIWDIKTEQKAALVENTRDLQAALGSPAEFPYRVETDGVDSAIVEAQSGRVVARYAEPFQRVFPHAGQKTWAGKPEAVSHLFLVTLEGEPKSGD